MRDFVFTSELFLYEKVKLIFRDEKVIIVSALIITDRIARRTVSKARSQELAEKF